MKQSSLLWQSRRNRAVRVKTKASVRQAMRDMQYQLWIREEVERGKRRVFKSK
jgi:hypothetical protein